MTVLLGSRTGTGYVLVVRATVLRCYGAVQERSGDEIPAGDRIPGTDVDGGVDRPGAAGWARRRPGRARQCSAARGGRQGHRQCNLWYLSRAQRDYRRRRLYPGRVARPDLDDDPAAG